MPENLRFECATARPDLLARPVAAALAEGGYGSDEIEVAEIAPEAADTATFCQRYGVPLDRSANTVLVSARGGGRTRVAACVVPSTTRVDVNGLVRRHLGARKASFAPTDVAEAETGMASDGITPLGLPSDWAVLVDAAVADTSATIVGSGLRRSKLKMPGWVLASLPNVTVLEELGRQ